MDGKYRILRPLGRGGDGSVWLAVHLWTEQFWAIKEIPRKEDGREFHELNMMKKLRHPSLPQILDILEDETQVYLIMEYINGHTLDEIRKKRGRLPPEEVLETGYQISSALCYLHSRTVPVFHLDIKPANIIQRDNGKLVLVDFGAAWKNSGAEKETRRRGTLGYAAPEQYDMARTVDARTDIYGLGATLYHLVSGVEYSPVLAKSKIPGCPEYLGEIIRKCVQENPDLRWEDSRCLYQKLGKIKRKLDFQKQRYRFWGALLLAVLVLGLAVRALPREFSLRAEQNWDYGKLLEEALCVNGEESLEYYLRAVFVNPNLGRAYVQYLRQADSDALFTRAEEERLRILLHTIPPGSSETYEELLAKNPEAYGEFAAKLGLVYWYDYAESDGRRIASGWFSKAVKAVERMAAGAAEKTDTKPGWAVQAEVFAHMGSYYESLGKRDETGEKGSFVREYWNDLIRLLEVENGDYDNGVTRLRFFSESVNQIIFLAEELWTTGISREKLYEVIDQIVRKAGETAGDQENGELADELKAEIVSRAGTAREVAEHLGK